MNPRDRKLRLRKTTVRDLSPQDASHVQGGESYGGLCSHASCPSEGILCPGSRYIPCPHPVPIPDTGGCPDNGSAPCSNGAWSNCIAC